MDINRRKEEFSVAYVHAIASVAGYAISRPIVDDDSVDIQFISNTCNPYIRSPRIEAQLKCTSQDIVRGGHIHLPLKMKNYDDLRNARVVVPRILVCVIVPSDDPASWLNHTEESLSLMKCGFWMSLTGLPTRDNDHTVTVHIPTHQTLNEGSLKTLMENVGRGVYNAQTR